MYDLLLFDIRMPGMNGFELYRKIKDIEEEEKKVKNGKPRVCFITAFEEFRSEFKETFPTVEEVDCFLKKPIPMPDLIKKVKSQLSLLQMVNRQFGYWPNGGSIGYEYTFLKVTVISFLVDLCSHMNDQIPPPIGPKGFTKNYAAVFKGYFCKYIQSLTFNVF